MYLFPRTSNKGPSFRIDSSVYAASHMLTRLVHGALYSEHDATPSNEVPPQLSLDIPDATQTTSPDQSQVGSSDGSKGSRALSDATDDDFVRNALRVLAEGRFGLTVHKPQGFAHVNLAP